MTKVIVYQNDNGGVAIIHPATDCGLTVEQVAVKDVPLGKPYAIVDASEIPEDRSARDAWTVDEVDLIDGIGGMQQ